MSSLVTAVTGLVLAAFVGIAGAPTASQTAAPPLCFGERATIVGTAASERIVGTSGDDVIVAAAGDDTVRGRAGADLICAGPGYGFVHGGPGDDRLRVLAGLLAGGGDDDVLVKRSLSIEDTSARGGTGDDRIRGLGIGDPVWPGPGHDVVHASSGWVRYRDALRPVTVDMSRHIALGQGRDRLFGVFFVDGSRFADTLIGDSGSNRFDGYGGDDTLFGGAGRDVLFGLRGHDQFDGGPGRDQCDDSRREVAVSCEQRR